MLFTWLLLERRALGPRADPEEADPLCRDQPLLAELHAASVQGCIALGPRAGHRVAVLGAGAEEDSFALIAPRCTGASGFRLHANVCIPARARRHLENLCRYFARPAITTERLSVLPDGRLLYELRHHWRNGATHVVFEPLEFLAKLAALVPPPRFNLVRYHGILASAAGWRSTIVSFAVAEEGPVRHEGCSGGKHHPQREKSHPCPCHPRKYTWTELMKRVWEMDVLECPRCGGRMRTMAAIHSPDAVRALLECLGLPSCAPPISPALEDEVNLDYPFE